MADKLSPEQHRRIEEIREYLGAVQHVKRLVADLEGSRAAKATLIQSICESIARALSELRQRTLTAKLGSVPDTAGAMSVMASRGGGLAMKLRGLSEGVASLTMELDNAMRAASTPRGRAGDA
jgi:hypothetical protein